MPTTPSSSAGRLAGRPSVEVPGCGFGVGLHPLDAIGLADHLLLVPPDPPSAAPLLVFFHGAGGHAARCVPLVAETARARRALVLLPTSAGGTWDLLAGGLGRDVAALDAALGHVLGSCDVGRVALGGFSDGASYALSMGLANGDLAPHLMAFSPGFAAPPERVGTPRVWVSHGTADTVLPVDRCGRPVVRTLREAGYDVTYEEFDGGHVVAGTLVKQAFSWWLDDSPA